MPRALVLLGPTAIGKSSLAADLAARLPVEIVSMDSAQVYRGMDIGTAKPSREERARVPHHLIDVVDPDQAYSSGRWRSDAICAAADILGRKRVPLFVGGTMLYYRALVGGLDALPPANAEIRENIDEQAALRGWPALHAELAQVDPRSAQRIAPNDSQRIQRALEVWRLTGKPLSALHGAAKSELPFRVKAFALVPRDRAELHRRIAARFAGMLQAGLIDEVKTLRRKYRLTPAMPSMRAAGYRQVWQYLEREIDAAALTEHAVAATRQLAKRQLTWLRGFEDVENIGVSPTGVDSEALASRIAHSFL
ncbi:MAG: tRNA isopentenyltransferase [Burkholderiales bacterium]|nr:tRNA isopentenyltransferase [Burkholderiales bacterium]